MLLSPAKGGSIYQALVLADGGLFFFSYLGGSAHCHPFTLTPRDLLALNSAPILMSAAEGCARLRAGLGPSFR